MTATLTAKLEKEVTARLAETEPAVEVLLCELSGGATLRVFVDHPDGVTLEVCERVTRQLRGLLERYSVEVSSPGPERPLTKAEHFRRFAGRKAKIRTRSEHDGRRTFTGQLIDSDDNGVTIALEDGVEKIELSDIRRASLVADKNVTAKPGPRQRGGSAISGTKPEKLNRAAKKTTEEQLNRAGE